MTYQNFLTQKKKKNAWIYLQELSKQLLESGLCTWDKDSLAMLKEFLRSRTLSKAQAQLLFILMISCLFVQYTTTRFKNYVSSPPPPRSPKSH